MRVEERAWEMIDFGLITVGLIISRVIKKIVVKPQDWYNGGAFTVGVREI